MSEHMMIYDPTAPMSDASSAARRGLEGLAGKVVGFIDNAKPNFNHLVDDIAEVLTTRYGVREVVKARKKIASTPATAEMLDEVTKQCDLVITGSGD